MVIKEFIQIIIIKINLIIKKKFLKIKIINNFD